MKLKELLNTPIRRMVARNIALSLVVGICLLYVALRDTRHMHSETIMFSTMSTFGTVSLAHQEKMTVSNALTAAHEAVREVETTCNIFDPGSELSRLNATAADEPFACSDLLWDVLTQARAFWKDSGGVFDINFSLSSESERAIPSIIFIKSFLSIMVLIYKCDTILFITE